MTTTDERRVRRLERRALGYDDLDSIPDAVLEAILMDSLPADIARWRAAADAGDAKMVERIAALRAALA